MKIKFEALRAMVKGKREREYRKREFSQDRKNHSKTDVAVPVV
jgi:hypothetical protein